MAEAGAIAGGKALSAIHVNLGGGPSHLDTFDPKPGAPDGIRGEFGAIDTRVPGLRFGEHLPKLAACADLFATFRGVSHTLAAHELGTKYLNTGNRPLPSLEFPGYGAVVSKELGGPRDIPPFVAIPDTPQVAGYLGVEYAPFSTQATPRAGRPFGVRGIALGRGLTVEEIEKRQNLLGQLDRTFDGFESSGLVDGLDAFSARAFDIIRSPRSREAFDISRESRPIAGLFGDDPFSQSCLLATRLVDAGVRFVSVANGGWDTHQDNFSRLKDRNLPQLDAGLSGLFAALSQKGMLDSTVVFVSGEFGRTPKINETRRPRPLPPGDVRPDGRRRDRRRPPPRRQRRDRLRPRVRLRLLPRRHRRHLLPDPRHRPRQGVPHPHRPTRRHRPPRHPDRRGVRLIERPPSLPRTVRCRHQVGAGSPSPRPVPGLPAPGILSTTATGPGMMAPFGGMPPGRPRMAARRGPGGGLIDLPERTGPPRLDRRRAARPRRSAPSEGRTH